MQNPTQELKSVKGLGNIFDLKWAGTLRLGNFHGIFIEPSPQIQISKLIFDTLLWA
jgi:hypothetical protein